jgi:phospholipase C
MSMSGTIDPAGRHGGPITDTNPDPGVRWTCDWPTMPEVLEDAGISWKVYHPSWLGPHGSYPHLALYPTWEPLIYDPVLNPLVMLASDHVLPYFRAYQKPTSPLHRKAFNPTFPADFAADVRNDRLPKVSWLIPPLGFDDHPSTSPERGMWFVQQVLDALTAHRKVWSKTVLFLMYDENDGFFDHVAPPTPPRGTHGEWLTAPKISSETLSIRGPVGLGMRVPCLVISPFSRGGHVVSDTFDHTSQLKFLHARWGVEVPNVSHWRRKTVGDLTSTLFHHRHDATVPRLPHIGLAPPQLVGSCSEVNQDTDQGGAGPSIPTKQRMPTQHGTTVSAKRYFKESPTAVDRIPVHSGRNTATKKSAYNPVAHGGAPAESRENQP